MKFTILDKEYIVEEGRELFTSIRKLVFGAAQAHRERFAREFGGLKSAEEKLREAAQLMYRHVFEAAGEAVRFLKEQGIEEASEQALIERSIRGSAAVDLQLRALLEACYEQIHDVSAAADDVEIDMDLHRAVESLMEGGKPQTDLLALLGQAGRKVEIGEETAQKLADDKLCGKLGGAVYRDIRKLLIGVVGAMLDGERFKVRGVYRAEARQAEELYRELSTAKRLFNRDKDRLVQLLGLDPYKEKSYLLILDRFPEESGETGKMACYFEVDVSQKCMEILRRKYDSLKIESEEDAREAKRIIEHEMDRHGIRQFDALQSIEGKIESLHQAECSYLGTMFESREACSKAKADDQQLDTLYDELSERADEDTLTRNEVLSGIRAVNDESITACVREKHSERFRMLLMRVDQQTVVDFFERVNFANETDKSKLEECLNTVGKMDLLPVVKTEAQNQIRLRIEGKGAKVSNANAKPAGGGKIFVDPDKPAQQEGASAKSGSGKKMLKVFAALVAIGCVATLIFAINVGSKISDKFNGNNNRADGSGASAEASQAMEEEPAEEVVRWYIVNDVENVVLLEKPEAGANIIMSLPVGTEVEFITEVSNGYCRIGVDGSEGFVLADNLANQKQTEKPASPGQVRYVVRCVEYITLRSSPSTEAEALTTIPLGDTVVLESAAVNDFARVKYHGQTGYVLEKFLATTPERPLERGEMLQVVNCSEYVSLRMEPDKSANAYCKIPVGSYVEFESVISDQFYLVTYNGYTGFALREYLEPTDMMASEVVAMRVVDCDEYITLRAAPDPYADAYCIIPLHSLVTYISDGGNGFYFVEYDGYRGYVLSKYLEAD